MSLIAPFDLETIFVTVLAGTPLIFSFLAIILVAYLAAYFKMPNSVALFFLALFGVIMATYLEGLYILLILLVGLISFYSISKLIR